MQERVDDEEFCEEFKKILKDDEKYIMGWLYKVYYAIDINNIV